MLQAKAEFYQFRKTLARAESAAELKISKDKSAEIHGWYDAPIYALCSGMVGSISVLLASCAMKTILWAIKEAGGKTFLAFSPYLFIGGMVATILTQVQSLSRMRSKVKANASCCCGCPRGSRYCCRRTI